MNLVSRLFGKKPPTSTAISDELAKHGGALSAVEQRIAKAAADRKAALEGADNDALRIADEARAVAERDREITEHAIARLQTLHAERVDVEHKEAFAATVEAHNVRRRALNTKIEAKYPGAAALLAGIADELDELHREGDRLRREAASYGEPIKLDDPEACRRAPKHFTVRWGVSDGTCVIGSPGDAPRGAIRWDGDRPVAARDDVTVTVHTPDRAPSLRDAIGSLPGLRDGEASFRHVSPPKEDDFEGIELAQQNWERTAGVRERSEHIRMNGLHS
jgi:hypothetical protein